ncbi:11059_t:CDS:2 [Ambispora leptoticha]|uniref:11059_t:CDS:1 n=1 Tax=Ambispora leptoticha TaxID=144679 RepID=A0A9N8WCK6_9GLOM|nr:11059_t:CDS:2 [Ambispora leptoticha]
MTNKLKEKSSNSLIQIPPPSSPSIKGTKRKQSPVDGSSADPKFLAEKEKLIIEIEGLEKKLEELRAEAKKLNDSLGPEINAEKEIQNHCRLLHEYNEIRDVGQMLFGKCAVYEGTTTKKMYEKFGVDLED